MIRIRCILSNLIVYCNIWKFKREETLSWSPIKWVASSSEWTVKDVVRDENIGWNGFDPKKKSEITSEKRTPMYRLIKNQKILRQESHQQKRWILNLRINWDKTKSLFQSLKQKQFWNQMIHVVHCRNWGTTSCFPLKTIKSLTQNGHAESMNFRCWYRVLIS